MEIKISEAAPLLGRSARAVRARIARGEIPARLHGKTWLIDIDHLPLTAQQREGLLRRNEELRRAVERSLPSRAAGTRDRKHRSALDLEPFAELRDLVCQAMAAEAPPGLLAVRDALREALGQLALSAHEFELGARSNALRSARRSLAFAVADLLLSGQDTASLDFAQTIEARVLPRIGGLLRWAERRSETGRRT
ncbi:MAG: hypothetical protein IT457_19695 [Planctomycetes bacterium]|nr:hypothetical protein [Planctomycetota bacterium]